MTCPNCSAQVPPGRRYCPECGERLFEKRRRHTFILVLIPAVLAIALVAALLPRTPPQPTPRERFLAANAALLAPVLDAVGGGYTGHLSVTADIPGDPLSPVLRLSALGVDLALEDGALVACASLRVLGAPMLTGTFTYSDGLVGVYVPALDESYYRFNLSSVVDLPSADTLSDYVYLALSLIAGGELELNEDDEGVETFVCRPDISDDLNIVWTLTVAEGEPRSVELSFSDYELFADLSEKSENITVSFSSSSQNYTVNLQIDTKNPPKTAPKPPENTPVFVPDSQVFALFDKLLGGVLDVL